MPLEVDRRNTVVMAGRKRSRMPRPKQSEKRGVTLGRGAKMDINKHKQFISHDMKETKRNLYESGKFDTY